MFIDDNTTPMSTDEFFTLRDFIYSHCGLHFEEDQLYLLEKRLSRRLSIHQLPTFSEYAMFLKYDPRADEEIATVVDLLTTNETYFFREGYQLKAFTEEVIPEIARTKKDKTLRVWSAGCSTGEEPYTIAMLLLDVKTKLGLNSWNIEILGSDISHRVLGVARRGVYNPTSFRETDKRYLHYFDEEEGGRRKIKDELKNMVSFMHLNLLDDKRIGLLRPMDVIFCRNVIIYFDTLAKKTVVELFHDRLLPGGYLLLGHSESLMNVTTVFSLKHLKNDMVYQRPAQGVALDGIGVGAGKTAQVTGKGPLPGPHSDPLSELLKGLAASGASDKAGHKGDEADVSGTAAENKEDSKKGKEEEGVTWGGLWEKK